MTSENVQSSSEMSPGSSETFYGPAIMLFVLAGLLCGILFRELNKKYGLPYTPLLMLLGVILGNIHPYIGEWGRGAFTIEAIHPHTGMSVFVPTLVFTGGNDSFITALGANIFMFKKSLGNILLLSIPGVILGSVLMAFVLKVILGYEDQDMNWMQAITLGCSLTSTDPVALVALLKEFGTTGKFNTLLEGQSLVSGAFSMILYYLLLDVQNGQITNAFEFTFATVRLTLGGIFVGLLFGILVSVWMKRIIKDHTLSIVITIIGSYLSFYLCEFTWLKFGGVAAVVVQGLYLAAVVKRKIYHESEQALDTVWSMMAFCAMTVLFTLIGVISGIQFVKYETLTKEDWIKAVLFWPLMIIVRAITVYGFYPILKTRGYGLSRKQLVVLIYGGLKGGLGLSLAMMITNDPYYPTRFRHLATLYMEGMVLMTVIINGMTCKKVVEYVEMIHMPQIKLKLLKKCINQVLKITSKKLQELKLEPQLTHAKWDDVEKLASINKLGEIETKHEEQAFRVSSLRDSMKDFKQGDIVEQIRFRFTRYLRKTFWTFYDQGEMSEQAIKTLSEICDIANDNSQSKLSYFENIEGAIALDTVNIYTRFRDYPLIGPFFSKKLVSKVYFLYEVSIMFVDSCEETIRVFKNDFPLTNQLLNQVITEARQNMDLFFAYIGQLETSFPDVTSAVHTRRASTIILKSKKNNLKKMYEEGFIDQHQYNILVKEVDENLLKTNFTELKFEQMRVNQKLFTYPLFESLSNPEIGIIKNKSIQKVFEKGSTVLDQDAEMNSVFLILSGSVREQFESFYLVKSIGSVINQYDVTLKKNSKCKVKALNTVKVMSIKAEVIDNLLNKNKEFKKKWYKSLFIYDSHLNTNLTFLHRTFSEKQFRRFLQSSEIKILKPGDKTYSEYGSYLFEGKMKSEDNIVYSQEEGIIPKEKVLQAIADCVILKFNRVNGVNVTDNLRVSNYMRQSEGMQ